MSLIERTVLIILLYIRGVLVEGFHCITMVGEIVAC